MTKKITIGITASESRFQNYLDWIQGNNANIELITLSYETQNTDDVKRCQGILLSGGVDITPAFYNSQRTRYPNMPKEWNKERDIFEMKILQLSIENRLPLLAICRGLQLLNTYLGGSLVPDLEESGKQDHKRKEDKDGLHTITIAENSLLNKITGLLFGEVNSAHHQAIDLVSESLVVNAVSTDGVIEGVEWKASENKSPLLGVQWHPERMEDKKTNPLSENILAWFLSEANKSLYENF